MTKLTLTEIKTYDKKKDGTPYVNQKGQPYTRLVIKTVEHGDKQIGGYLNATTRDWKVKDTVEVELEQNGDFLNFSVPKPLAVAAGEISALKTTIGKLNFKVEELEICIEGLAHKAGLKVKELRALAEEAKRGYAYPVNDGPEPSFGGEELPEDMTPNF